MKKLSAAVWVEDTLREQNLDPIEVLNNEKSFTKLAGLNAREFAYPVQQILSIIQLIADEQKEEAVKEALGRAYRPQERDTTWMQHVAKNDWKLHQKVMDHWVWMLKRKMAGLPVDNHKMVIFSGKTNAGKSVLVGKIAETLPEWCSGRFSVDVYDDKRNVAGVCQTHIQIYDEMERITRADIDTLKSAITAQTINYRPMGTNATMQAIQRGVFIGTTNYKVNELIKDETSMRRFWDIEVKDQIEWDKINMVDFQNYLASINHLGNSPMKPVNDRVLELQAGQVRNQVKEFLDQAKGDGWVFLADLYKEYIDFCRMNAFPAPKTGRSLATQLRNMGMGFRRDKWGMQVWLDGSMGLASPETHAGSSGATNSSLGVDKKGVHEDEEGPCSSDIGATQVVDLKGVSNENVEGEDKYTKRVNKGGYRENPFIIYTRAEKPNENKDLAMYVDRSRSQKSSTSQEKPIQKSIQGSINKENDTETQYTSKPVHSLEIKEETNMQEETTTETHTSSETETTLEEKIRNRDEMVKRVNDPIVWPALDGSPSLSLKQLAAAEND